MNSSCPICLDLFDGRNIVATPCGHVFHSNCICKWIDNSKFCPECRSKVTKNNVMKLFFNTAHSETLPLYPTIQNDLDSKKAELREKEAELSASNKKIKELQRHASDTEQLYQSMYQKYLAAQSEVEISKLHLKKVEKLESKIKNLAKENLNLESQVNQFHNVQTILQGTQHEADEILREQGISLTQEVGGQIAKNMANLCSILKRELCKLRVEKEQFKKRESELLYKFGLKNARLKDLENSQADLKKQLKTAIHNAIPSPCPSRPQWIDVSKSQTTLPTTPVSTNCNYKGKPSATNSSNEEESSKITPITIDFSERKGPAMKKVVLHKLTGQSTSTIKPVLPFAKRVLTPAKRKHDIDEDSVIRIGYNGLGCHERVIFARSQALKNPKPYKKNPNIKRVK